MQGVVGRESGWQQLGSSWDAVSSIPTVSQLRTYQSLSPSSVTSHHISLELPKFGSSCRFPALLVAALRMKTTKLDFWLSVFSLEHYPYKAGSGTRLDNFFWIAMAFMIF